MDEKKKVKKPSTKKKVSEPKPVEIPKSTYVEVVVKNENDVTNTIFEPVFIKTEKYNKASQDFINKFINKKR